VAPVLRDLLFGIHSNWSKHVHIVVHDKGDWRLLYVTSSDNVDSYHNEEPSYDSTPLLETPVRTRLAARPFLAQLVSEIAELVPDNQAEPVKSKKGVFSSALAASKKPAPPEDLDAIFSSEDEIPF
jgi:hypothetical protein